MTYEEAVEMMKNTLYDVVQEARDSLQDTMEEIVIEYYGWEISKWKDTSSEGEQLWLEQQEIVLEDLAWSDIGVAALIRLAVEYQRDRPPQVEFSVRMG